jgi:hypothetical protein
MEISLLRQAERCWALSPPPAAPEPVQPWLAVRSSQRMIFDSLVIVSFRYPSVNATYPIFNSHVATQQPGLQRACNCDKMIIESLVMYADGTSLPDKSKVCPCHPGK